MSHWMRAPHFLPTPTQKKGDISVRSGHVTAQHGTVQKLCIITNLECSKNRDGGVTRVYLLRWASLSGGRQPLPKEPTHKKSGAIILSHRLRQSKQLRGCEERRTYGSMASLTYSLLHVLCCTVLYAYRGVSLWSVAGIREIHPYIRLSFSGSSIAPELCV